MPNILPPFKLDYDYLDGLHAEKEYQNYEPQIIKGRRFEHIQISLDSTVFRLQDKNQLDVVSVVVLERVEYFNNEYYEIKWTTSSTPKRRFLSYLFDLLLTEFKFTIISDKTHTSPGSKEYWLSLGRKRKYELFIYNVDTNYKRRYINVSEDKIWGLKDDYLDEVNTLLLDFKDFEVFERQEFEEEEYEFEGFEDIDMQVLDTTVATKEIYQFVNKHYGVIKDRNQIRLIAQKTT